MAFKHDEFNLSEQLLEHLVPSNGSTDQDWIAVRQTLKKPIFSFLNNDMVKKIRILTAHKIEEQESQVE
jgi:predicted P-loop ATPase